MAKRLLRRYVWLLDTIRSANGITFEEINRKWLQSSLNENGNDLPKRTFHDHIDAILDEFDIEITCDRGDSYRYYINEFEEYGSVRKSMIDALILDNAVRESPEIGGRVVFHDLSHTGNLPVLVHAIKDRKVIRFRYRHDYSYARRTTPGCESLPDTDYLGEMAVYGLFFCCIWFTVGKVASDQLLHIYALHRLSEIELLEQGYDFPEDFDVRQFMTEYTTKWTTLAEGKPGLEDDGSSLEIYKMDLEPSILL